MKRKQTAALITALLGISVILYYMTVVYAGDQYRIIGGAVVLAVEVMLMGVIALIIMADKEKKDIGQGILIGTGITLLIGFGICSAV